VAFFLHNIPLEVLQKKRILITPEVGKGTMYRNFKSKEDLLDRLLKEKGRSIVERFSSFVGEPDSGKVFFIRPRGEGKSWRE
jgi:hypothetical protein